MNFKGKEISEEIIAKAMACKSAEELMKLAKAGGIELTKDEAEAYLSETGEVELTDEELKYVAGGDIGPGCWTDAQPVRRRRGPRY